MTQCVATFDGLDVQVSASMTRSPGVSPDVGTLVWRQGTTQPTNAQGDLVFSVGGTAVYTFHDCILDDPTEKRGRYLDYVYKVKDRRWKWAFPRLFGSYNIRDKDKEIIASTQKTPRELAELALNALEETGYNVEALPTDAKLAPEVRWHYTPAAEFLEKLCALFGCQVHLLADDTVKIVQMGTGTVPDDTGLTRTPEVGLIINPAPANITAYAGDTLFESWLLLDAIGYETDGTVKPIEMLSYRPDDGWDVIRKGSARIWNKLKGTDSEELIDRKVELAMRHVFRTYRVIGFPNHDKPPGYEEDDFPMTKNESGKWKIYDKDFAEAMNGDDAEEFDTKIEAEDRRRQHLPATHIIAPPGAAIFDPRVISPLFPTRVTYGDGLDGKKKRMEPEVMGVFNQKGMHGVKISKVINGKYSIWREGISVNADEAIITLSDRAYTHQIDTGTSDEAEKSWVEAPQIYLRIGYRIRQVPYGNVYHRQFTIATGSNTGTANGVVARTDIQQQMIANYTSPYVDFSAGTPNTNTTVIDAVLENAATENRKKYQNVQAPQKRIYTPFRAVDTDGKVQQVQFQCGVMKTGETIVSVGAQYDQAQPPAAAKAIREIQRKQAEQKMQEFTATRIENVVVEDSRWGFHP